MATYSFRNVTASLVGATGMVDIGYGAGSAEEGITISPANDRDVMTVGADGEVMHSLREDKSGTATIRLLDTSPSNSKLQLMFAAQSLSSTLWGANVLTVINKANNETIVCRDVAFTRQPAVTFSANGTIREWVFNCGKIDIVRGDY